MSQVATILRSHGLPCGNEPLAVYQYASPTPSHDTSATPVAGEATAAAAAVAAAAPAAAAPAEGNGGALAGAWDHIAWDLPKVTRYCGVFRTKGDRRLGDHLLGGLELLLKDVWPLNPRELWQLAHEINNTRRGLVLDEEPSGQTATEPAAPNGGESSVVAGKFGNEPPSDGDWGVMATDMLPFLADPPPPPADLSDLRVAAESAPPRVATEEIGQVQVPGGENRGTEATALALPGGEAGLTSAGCAVAQRLGIAPLFARVWNDAIDELETATMAGAGAEAGTGTRSERNATTTISAAADGNSHQPARSSSVVLLLAWRLGYECGRVQCLLRSNGVSWGTYPDSMGTHCNAHANNMVVLPPLPKRAHTTKYNGGAAKAAAKAAVSGATSTSGAPPPELHATSSWSHAPSPPTTKTPPASPTLHTEEEEENGIEGKEEEPCLLAPVDFDMAFTQSSYLPELATAACPGFDADWTAVMALEAEGFYGTLAGSDFASTGVANRSHRAASEGVDPGDPRRVALRDTLCRGFRCGLAGEKDPQESKFLQRKPELDALVRLCLVVTAGDIA